MIFSVILAPRYGCDAITDDGTCFIHYTSSGSSWHNAKRSCISRGYNLATVKNPRENYILYSTRYSSSSKDCWIGLSDINNEGEFVWSDGSTDYYRNWHDHEPNHLKYEDCVHFWGGATWNDRPCSHIYNCYFCSTNGKKT